MTINDEILAIANQLANQGKKPSVALIKTRLTQQVPLPSIISVLKTWQHDPEFVQVNKQPIANLSAEKENNEELSLLVKQAIEPLKQEIIELKQLIQNLLKK